MTMPQGGWEIRGRPTVTQGRINLASTEKSAKPVNTLLVVMKKKKKAHPGRSHLSGGESDGGSHCYKLLINQRWGRSRIESGEDSMWPTGYIQFGSMA